jgi:hypothetical protein
MAGAVVALCLGTFSVVDDSVFAVDAGQETSSPSHQRLSPSEVEDWLKKVQVD